MEKNKLKLCSFGEILIRLNPYDNNTFSSLPKNLELNFGGSELNFLINISNLGGIPYLISALPDNPLGAACFSILERFKINKRYIKKSKKGRMGLYFVEEGVANRSTRVTYDRKGSSFNLYRFDQYPFGEAFLKSTHYHISGITPGLSRNGMYSVIQSVRLAKEMGLEVSCDLNYRSKLWNYKIDGEIVNKERVMSDIAVYCDYLFGNETDIQNFFKINIKNNEFEKEEDNIIYYQNLLLALSKRFPHIKIIAISIRNSINANSNYIGGALYIRQTNQFYFSPNINNRYKPYLVDPILDRIGSGDAFSSGFIFGLHKFSNVQLALDLAVASSVLKHSYRGDFNYATLDDMMALIKGDKYGRIKR